MIKLHPSYPTDVARVGLVGTLLTSTSSVGFPLLLDKHPPVLEDFKGFQAKFGDTDSMRTAINKIKQLHQGDCLTSTYASNFPLLTFDIPWDEEALMDQFHQGPRNDDNANLFH